MTRIQTLLFGIHVIVLGFGVAPDRSGAEPTDTVSLTLTVADGKTTVLPLLPVVLTIELNNKGDEMLEIPALGFGLEESYVGNRIDDPRPRYEFTLAGPDSSSRTVYLADWVNWSADPVRGMAVPPLHPGQTIALDYCLGYGVSRFLDDTVAFRDLSREAFPVFPHIGDYIVRLTLPRLGPSRISSNEIRISVVEPGTPPDVLAHSILAHSRVPNLFLSPPLAYGARGISPLDWRDVADATFSGPLETCRSILDRCPDSAYAFWARLFWATALSGGLVERVLDAKPTDTVDYERRFEGIRLLRQCAEDRRLPRRFREEALLSLQMNGESLGLGLRDAAISIMPSIEDVLGTEHVDLQGVSPPSVFQYVYRAMHGPNHAAYQSLLDKRFSPEQINLLQVALASDPTIADAAQVSSRQLELRDHILWARGELAKIPWRNPNTGTLPAVFTPGGFMR